MKTSYLNFFKPFTLILLSTWLFSCEEETPHGASADWAHYLGHPSSNQYSTLDQIDKDNVAQLEIAWTYITGDSAQYQTNNLIIKGVVYTATPKSKVVALNGENGQHLWTFDPDDLQDGLADGDQRGLMYWTDGKSGRILGSKGSLFYALDALTGQPISSFGQGGVIHLGEGMDVEGTPNVTLNTPGVIYKDLFIIGGNVNENIPGAIRAFDVRTGDRKWIFHTLPRPGEPGAETWPADYLDRTGGASDWSGIALDEKRGIVYSSTETAGPDFYGGDRYGENLYANSVVALDVNTGKKLWHQQIVHHDLWDLDNPAPPTLLTINHEGESRDILAQGTKMGLLFVFDRVTGEPIWPIEERPTPPSKIQSNPTWPTQPFPTIPPPLMRQRYTENDFSNVSEEARQLSEDVYQVAGNYGAYPAPTEEQVIMFPGFDGGMEWGGSAADQDGILYTNVNEIPWFYQLVPTKQPDGSVLALGEKQYRIQCSACHGMDRMGNPSSGFPALQEISKKLTKDKLMQVISAGSGRMPAFDHLSEERREAIVNYLFGMESSSISTTDDDDAPPYVFGGFQRFLDAEGYPAIKPPWGTLNAVDLNTGTIKWKVPLGEYPTLTARGIPPTGTENYGGPIVTASGLIFIGATADAKFRAFDKMTGEMLWEHDLPFDGNSTPSTYMANGKQYIVISAGNAKKKPIHGGTVVAFALSNL